MRNVFLFALYLTASTIIISCKKGFHSLPPVIVSDANLNGWAKEQVGTPTVGFVNNPFALLGKGSIRYTTAPDHNHSLTFFARLRNT